MIKINNENIIEDPFVSLARRAVEEYIKTGKILEIPLDIPKELLSKRAGVFVSVHRSDGSLRGCIGTFLPTKENIAQEIVTNAISSATEDPRFPPVSEEELPELVYSVDILSSPRKVSGINDLDVKKYGLIVSTPDGRRGLLLPDIPGVKTPEEQFKICCYKGGIAPNEKVTLQIFTVERHHSK